MRYAKIVKISIKTQYQSNVDIYFVRNALDNNIKLQVNAKYAIKN